MMRLIISLAVLLPMSLHAAPERRGRGGGGASARSPAPRVNSKIRRKSPSVRVKAKPKASTLNVRRKSQPADRSQPAARGSRGRATGAAGSRASGGRASNGRSRGDRAARPAHQPARRGQPASRSRRSGRAHAGYRSAPRRSRYQSSRRSRHYAPVYRSRRRGPRHPGWSRRHFRVSHHSPLTVIIERSVLQSRLTATRNDLAQVEYAIRGLAHRHIRDGLMHHVRAIGYALDDIDAALYRARPYRSYRRGWVILDQRSFWRRLRAAESALARLDDEVAGLQDAQGWSGHARLGGLDSNLGALGSSLMGADAYAQPSAQAPAAEPPVSEAEFGKLERALHAATFRTEKFDLVRRAVLNQYFTTAQARGIARQIHAGPDKVKVLTWLYPRLVDAERFESVMDDLPSEDDRRQLELNVYGQ